MVVVPGVLSGVTVVELVCVSYSRPEVVRWIGLCLPVRVCNGPVPGFVGFLRVAIRGEAGAGPVWLALVVAVVVVEDIVLIVVLTNSIPILVYVALGVTDLVFSRV